MLEGTADAGDLRDPAHSEVLYRYARLTNHGRPDFCHCGNRRQRGGGEVIYPTREAAEAAARELEALGARPLRPYPCAQSGGVVHYHLTADLVRRLHEHIPKQRGTISI